MSNLSLAARTKVCIIHDFVLKDYLKTFCNVQWYVKRFWWEIFGIFPTITVFSLEHLKNTLIWLKLFLEIVGIRNLTQIYIYSGRSIYYYDTEYEKITSAKMLKFEFILNTSCFIRLMILVIKYYTKFSMLRYCKKMWNISKKYW